MAIRQISIIMSIDIFDEKFETEQEARDWAIENFREQVRYNVGNIELESVEIYHER